MEKKFHEILKEARLNAGLTQSQLAEMDEYRADRERLAARHYHHHRFNLKNKLRLLPGLISFHEIRGFLLTYHGICGII